MIIDERQFREWWDVFHSDNPVTEIRLLGNDKSTASGYFCDCETALNALRYYPHQLGVYSPVNEIDGGCYSRPQRDCFMKNATTTSANDVKARRWILIDIDPERAANTNATDEEKAVAKSIMLQIGSFLRDQGFRAPVVMDSCNGYHLLYRVNIVNSPEATALVKDFLAVLDMLFSIEKQCTIDLQVSDPNRISKIAGTKSAKGFDSPERPQRFSRFVRIPEKIEATDIAFVAKIAAMLPVTEKPSRFNHYDTSFDIEKFITDHGIEVTKRQRFSGGTKLILKECPFDSNHKAPDSALFVLDSGAIGFKCLHNSCSAYTWRDVRLHFDPQAYDRRDVQEYQMKRDYYSSEPRPAPVVLEETDDKGKKWMTMDSIQWEDPSKLTYIPTGFDGIDSKIGGLALGDVSIISGLAGAGKTTILNAILMSAIQHGYKCAIWSGELAPRRFKSWFNQACAGANFVRSGTRNGKEYHYCPQDVEATIDAWTKDKVFLYNNNYGNRSSQILKDVRDCVRDRGAQLLVFDNKMAMALDSYVGDKNEREAGLINELKDFAIQSKLHIILVCHPRKEVMSQLLRMESIAGNSDLYNCAANVFLIHKVGLDFERRAKEFFGSNEVENIKSKMYQCVIEIAKNRDQGSTDIRCGLYYEDKTRRLLNDIADYVVYGWQEGYKPPQTDPRVQGKVKMMIQPPTVEEWEKEDEPIEDLPE